ncbi:uncharacterized protein DNG_10110 [Cephalotrichum gorgonifer]|uniref:Uncharacterized protein n=1 Tax=Cephalotrichum gorgonifer TaxID=2041049 RepID=A0AAE8N702_9PEZI|nr:uncharacterized protein DNG_10110 [Cephalotrichum gorgonifer]
MEHYTSFAPTSRVTRRDLSRKHHPVKEFLEPTTSPWTARLPPGSLPKLVLGFKAVIMDHKWHVYTEGPEDGGIFVVHFLRSWTVNPVVSARVQAEPDSNGSPMLENAADIVEITWEADTSRSFLPDQVETAETAKKWVVDVCEWVFGIEVLTEVGGGEPGI